MKAFHKHSASPIQRDHHPRPQATLTTWSRNWMRYGYGGMRQKRDWPVHWPSEVQAALLSKTFRGGCLIPTPDIAWTLRSIQFGQKRAILAQPPCLFPEAPATHPAVISKLGSKEADPCSCSEQRLSHAYLESRLPFKSWRLSQG